MKGKIGIYKITSPSGKVYIGQSWDIGRRFYNYKKYGCPMQRHLHNSLIKYGGDAHVFELIHELPKDVEQGTVDSYEQLYMDLYRDCGLTLLNLKGAGNFGKHSEETKKKISETKKGIDVLTPEARKRQAASMMGKPGPRKGKSHTAEAKIKIKAKRALQTNIKGLPIGNIPWNKGLVGIDNNWKGKNHSVETKEKIRQKLLGSKLSPETIAKRTATLKKNGVKRKWSPEAKRRQSERLRAFNRRMKLSLVSNQPKLFNELP